MSKIFDSADIAETMNNGVLNVTGADSTITENYSNVVQHGIKIDMSVSEKTISGEPPLSFNSNGTPLTDYVIYGNSVQDVTPTPERPVDVNGVGNFVGGNYIIPITTNVTASINLNSVTTTRRIKKLVLTGEETYTYESAYSRFITALPNAKIEGIRLTQVYCTHFISVYDGRPLAEVPNNSIYSSDASADRFFIKTTDYTTVADFKSYLAAQYAAGTPVTIWYVLAEPETGVVNEPLMKIGDYADSVSYAQSSVTIPTASGNNTIDVQTTPKPSSMAITYKGR